MSARRADDAAAAASLVREPLGSVGSRHWFTTIATALVRGAFLGAVPAAATIVVPFAVIFIVPVAIVGSVLGVASALGASAAVAANWRLIESRRGLGHATAALGGFLGCAALIPIRHTLVRNDPTPVWVYLGIAALAGFVAATQLAGFTRRLAVRTDRRVGAALLATLAAMAAAAVASALAAIAANLGGTGWAADEACRDTLAYGDLVRRVVAYIPAQSTCVYRDGSVETIARSDHALIALLAGLGLLAAVVAWVLFAASTGEPVLETQLLALAAAAAATLLLLALFGSSLYGALGPVITARP